jgi:hypothetical protein
MKLVLAMHQTGAATRRTSHSFSTANADTIVRHGERNKEMGFSGKERHELNSINLSSWSY